MIKNKKIAVVIPCYKVKQHILEVLKNVPEYVDKIYLIDDCCPQNTGRYVFNKFKSKSLKIIYHTFNQGVGVAVISGYKEAIKDIVDVVVKIDGDGQMNPSLISKFVNPIIINNYDYTKGNRFYELKHIMNMPKLRIFGNSILSFINKFSSGYWNIFDPNNGYTAINLKTLKKLPLEKISNDFFFESDMLFRLNLLKSRVLDVSIKSIYENEKSNIKIKKIIFLFIFKHIRNFSKRFFYNYILRDVSIGTFEFIFGLLFLGIGSVYGAAKWYINLTLNTPTPTGTVVISAVSLILGVQFLLAFIHNDIENYYRNNR